MFHPVGSRPPSVYWRRRLLLLGGIAIVIVLIALTVKTATGGHGTAAGGANTPAGSAQDTPGQPTRHTTTSSSTAGHTSASVTKAASHTSSVPVSPACDPKDLAVAAVVGKSSYQVGDQPLVELQVTNVGTKPCVQDLADKQIELRVYNGESRVWGSHDCQIQPGTNDKTLAVHTPVRVAITWSGLTSQPKCAGTRQRVGAGTYTLYALLSGKTGKAAQFTIS